jgi:MATE family multidrug resistance protein
MSQRQAADDGLARSALFKQAWPVFIAQIAAIGNSVVDTVMAGQLSALDLAAVSLGASIYISVYVGLMGVLLALAPIVGRHWGAGRFSEIGLDAGQGVWLALALALIGCPLLGASELWLTVAQPPPEVAQMAARYLWVIAAALPAALLFRVFQAIHNGMGRPRVVMLILLGGLAIKVPLNALLMHGVQAWGVIDLKGMGGAGCAVATAIVAWTSLLAAGWMVATDPEYRNLGLWPWRVGRPQPERLREILRLGIPTGLSYLIEVTSFSFIALFIARFGMIPAASHQIASNLAALTYMLPLSIAIATSTLTAQALGAGRPSQAQTASLLGIRTAMMTGIVTALSIFLGRELIAGAYTSDPSVASAALPLLVWIAAFHLFDALQVVLSFSLRAYQIATLPMWIYAVSLWGIGLGGGSWLTFIAAPQRYQGALGFWVAATVGLGFATAALALLQRKIWKQQQITMTVATR